MPVRRPLTLLLTAAVLALPASAALPPPYQRLAEFRAVIDHPEIASAFGADLVTRIEIVREDLYRVSGTRCRLDLAIVSLPNPSGMVGPRRFEVRAVDRSCA